MSDQSVSVFRNLTLLFLVINGAFLSIIYVSFYGIEMEFLSAVTQLIKNDFEVLLYMYGISMFLGVSYIFLLIKKYGISLTFAVMPQFAFIGTLGAVFL